MVNPMVEALDIDVIGCVQGVGFRPFVYRCALKYGLTGWVLNAINGVRIHVEGVTEKLDLFVLDLSSNAPEAAQVREIDLHEARVEGFDTFEIRFSDDEESDRTTLVSPDLATCAACERELFDPSNRRYHYPFINCTNCGPRFTIIEELPYDRCHSSMKDFELCDRCEEEYNDVFDRRFHAQPNACFDCGPRLGWIENDLTSPQPLRHEDITWANNLEQSDALIQKTVLALLAGKIVAVKGLGGYHLVCDASNAEALALLRERKHRFGKAFAVMAANVEAAAHYAFTSPAEGKQLTSPVRPIVLLEKRDSLLLAEGLADDLPELGVMLPTTPVQHLLIRAFQRASDDPFALLVMTSGNFHEEPIVATEDEAFARLAGIADAFLVNNRAIVERYDDSVLRVLNVPKVGEIVQVIRRARGLAPYPIALPDKALQSGAVPSHDSSGGSSINSTDEVADRCEDTRNFASRDFATQVFATGPELKNTFTFTRGDEAFVSQHLGDMESAANFDNWLDTRAHYQKLFHLHPSIIAHDMHPEYLTSKWVSSQDLATCAIQHHHAHIVAAMAENKLEGPVCGIAFDGTGYGVDGAIWGGEALLSNLSTYERFVNVAYFPLPGSTQAIKHTQRVAYGVLWAFDLLEHPAAQAYFADQADEVVLMEHMIESGINTPYTSSMGRLFDAASALLGICDTPRYEGEGAILLESVLDPATIRAFQSAPDSYDAFGGSDAFDAPSTPDADERMISGRVSPDTFDAPNALGASERPYQFALVKNSATEASTALDTSVFLLDPEPVFRALLDDLAHDVSIQTIAGRFHEAVVGAILMIAQAAQAFYDINTVVLSGGVFMNKYLLTRTLYELHQEGFTVALNRDLPPNDACISYGQAVVALHSYQEV